MMTIMFYLNFGLISLIFFYDKEFFFLKTDVELNFGTLTDYSSFACRFGGKTAGEKRDWESQLSAICSQNKRLSRA